MHVQRGNGGVGGVGGVGGDGGDGGAGGVGELHRLMKDCTSMAPSTFERQVSGSISVSATYLCDVLT